jgi:hypothetical protein
MSRPWTIYELHHRFLSIAASYIRPMLCGGFTISTRHHPQIIDFRGDGRRQALWMAVRGREKTQPVFCGAKFGWSYCIFSNKYDLRIAVV